MYINIVRYIYTHTHIYIYVYMYYIYIYIYIYTHKTFIYLFFGYHFPRKQVDLLREIRGNCSTNYIQERNIIVKT